NGDGFADIVTGAAPGGGPNFEVYNGQDGTIRSSFFAYDLSFVGGVTVAAGDVRHTGVAQVITGPGRLDDFIPAAPPVAMAPTVFELEPFSGTPVANFLAYAADFSGGVRVGIGRAASDNRLIILTGKGFLAT